MIKNLIIASSIALLASTAYAREIQIAGSSTVLPFASATAEQFSETYTEFPAPVVASGGTGAGLKQFCQGVGEDTIDIANASRKMKDAERENCVANGVTDIREIQFGYDGIVLASATSFGQISLTSEEVYKAIAAQVQIDGQMVDNPYKTWKDINPNLPDTKINLAIPAQNHGTREVFEQKLIEAGCTKGLEKEVCLKFRTEGVMEISGDYTETLARIQADPTLVGVFGLSFYEENADKLLVADINGVTPTSETIVSGEYPVSRPLFFYVKGAHIGVVPGIDEYVKFFLSPEVNGEEGSLKDIGLIVQPQEITDKELADYEKGE